MSPILINATLSLNFWYRCSISICTSDATEEGDLWVYWPYVFLLSHSFTYNFTCAVNKTIWSSAMHRDCVSLPVCMSTSETHLLPFVAATRFQLPVFVFVFGLVPLNEYVSEWTGLQGSKKLTHTKQNSESFRVVQARIKFNEKGRILFINLLRQANFSVNKILSLTKWNQVGINKLFIQIGLLLALIKQNFFRSFDAARAQIMWYCY